MYDQLTQRERQLVDHIQAAYDAANAQGMFVRVYVGGAGNDPNGVPRPGYPRLRQVLSGRGITNANASNHHNHFHVSLKPPPIERLG
jgi:hypothetical protein